MNISELIPLIPELFLSLAGMALLIWGAFGGARSTFAVSVGAGLSFVLAITAVVALWGVDGTILSGHVGINHFTQLIKIMMLGAGLVALVLSHHFLKATATGIPEFPVLILFALLGMMLMVSSESLLSLYMGLELQSLTLYVLAAYRRDDARSSEAGLKYFVLGALASGLLLYGISLTYGATGSIMFDKLAGAFTSGAKAPVEAVLGLVFILAALAFKISAVPFHMWTPDVYEGAPTPVTAFFASAPKLAGFALLIKVLMVPFIGLAKEASQIIVLLSLASMGLGAFAAIAQSSIKRLMAYSSIGHVGFALAGLVAASQTGVESSLLYLLIYLPMTLGVFAVILSLRRDDAYIENISDLAGLSKTRPALAAVMTVLLFSMIGLPPLAGFFGKFNVFMAAVQAGYVWLAIVGVVFSVIGAFYYLRIIKIMYFDTPQGHFGHVPGWGVAGVLGLSALFVLAFILQPEAFIALTRDAAAALLHA